MDKKQPPLSEAKAYLRKSFVCPNIYCKKVLDSSRSFQLHLTHSSDCLAFFTKTIEWTEPSLIKRQQQKQVSRNNTAGLKTTGLDDEIIDVEATDIDFEPQFAWETSESEEELFQDNQNNLRIAENDGVNSNNSNSDNQESDSSNNDMDTASEASSFHINVDVGNNFTFTAFNPANINENLYQTTIERMKSIQNLSQSIFNDFCYLNEDKHQVKLLHLLNKSNVPHFIFDQVQKWARDAYHEGYDFNPDRFTRTAQVKHLTKWLGLDHVQPEVVLCSLPGPTPQFVPVTRFDFASQLISLLTDPRLVGDINNLDVNPDDPFGKFVSEDGRLTCFNSGEWYNDVYNKYIDAPNKLLCPIIFTIDESQVTGNGRTSCCPVLFTTSLFTQSLRNRSIVWRPLGYIYELSNIESADERQTQSNDLKYARLHAIYATVLETFIYAQRTNILDGIELTFGNVTKTVDIIIPCAYIIGDIQGGDKICCSSPAYSNKMSRICRKCNVRGEDVGNPDIICKRIRMTKIKQLVANNQVQALEKLNQYNVYCAWFDVDFGGCKYGIFSAAMPIEPLHSLENGLMLDCLHILYSMDLTTTTRSHLDILVKKMVSWPRQYYISSGSQKAMPTLLWKSGISQLSLLSGNDKVGIMLTIVVLSLTTQGTEYFNNVLKDNLKRRNMQEVFQMMLCYWMWLKKDTYWQLGDLNQKETYKDSIRLMLRRLNELWPRMKGQGWAKAKFHEQLHVPDDIERNGSPSNTHSGPTEHNHIEFIKNPARRTQKRQDKLDQQIAQRCTESLVITTANDAIKKYDETHQTTAIAINSRFNNGPYNRAGKLVIYRSLEGQTLDYFVDKKKECMQLVENEFFELIVEEINEIPNVLWERLDRQCSSTTISFYSEYRREGIIFRSHPSYRSNHAWHDWVIVRWREERPAYLQPMLKEIPAISYGDETTRSRYCYTPCRLFGLFLQLKAGETYAVVIPCEYKCKQSSVFTTRWEISYSDAAKTIPTLMLINCDSIVCQCCMIPEDLESDATSRYYHELWPREIWGDNF